MPGLVGPGGRLEWRGGVPPGGCEGTVVGVFRGVVPMGAAGSWGQPVEMNWTGDGRGNGTGVIW